MENAADLSRQFHPIIYDDVLSVASIDKIHWNSLKDKTILITGASGLIGSYLVYTLLCANEARNLRLKVIGLVRNKEKAKKQFAALLKREDFQLMYKDVTEPLKTTDTIHYIIHAASPVGRIEFIQNPLSVISANINGTENLLQYAAQNPVDGFLFISSREIYGESVSDKRFISEDDYGVVNPTLVRSCYPESKRMAENLCVCYAAQYHVPVKIARLAHVYGPEYSLSSNRVWEDFIEKAISGEDIVLNSDGSGELALTYVSDAVSGLMFVLLNGDELVYNVSNTSEIMTVRELAELAASLVPEKKIKVVCREAIEDMGYLKNKVAMMSDEKVKGLGLIYKVSLKNGLRRIMNVL